MFRAKNESKMLTKDRSFECKCKFDRRKCNSNQQQNSNKGQCDCGKHHTCEKEYIWNPATCTSKNVTYLTIIMDD